MAGLIDWLNTKFRGSRGVLLQSAACFLALALATVSIWSMARKDIQQSSHERFLFKVAESQDAVRQRLLAYEQVLRGASALLATNSELSRADWWTYVDHLALKRNFPGIQAMAYMPTVSRENLEAYITKVRHEGFPDFTIKPGGDRDLYVPVTYIEPFDWRNRRAFGFDLITEPVRREALLRARDIGAPTASGKITLKQETDQGTQSGFLMCTPLFPGGTAPIASEARRANVTGYICAVFRLNDLMQGIFGLGSSSDARLEIFDGSSLDASHLMYDSVIATVSRGSQAPAFIEQRMFEFGGRTWALRASSTPAFDATIDEQKPRLILFGGLLVSMLFAGVIWSSGQNRLRSLQIAAANRDLEQLAKDLNSAKNAAEAASQAKEDFLANVSHELRTPLTLILAPLEQLNTATTPPKDWNAHIERMTRNALLLLNRVNDILDFSKANAGKFEIHWASVVLSKMFAPLLNDAAAVASSTDRVLSWSIDDSLGAVTVDPQHFEKILLNLVGNALKFTPTGGWIKVEMTKHDATRLELSVSNSGAGIARERLPELFNRFHQIDASATRQQGGTGIGLALVKQLATLMGGEVGVQSEAGNGARFCVQLPCSHQKQGVVATTSELSSDQANKSQIAMRRACLDEAAGANLGSESIARQRQETPHARVLVADDNADMRAYITGLLEQDFAVSVAADGIDAWELLQQQPFDVVVSDVMMPRMDGLALTARIKADSALAKLPVILVTARGGAEASSAGLACGANDYIAKPFSPCELQARVHAALRMATLQSQLRDASREAGMAMLASGILHNVGNLLCNVSVSATMLLDTLRRSEVGEVGLVAKLLEASRQAPVSAMPAELPDFITLLARRLQGEHDTMLTEVAGLRDGITHAAAIIAEQRDFAKPSRALLEIVSIKALLDTALSLSKHRITQLGITIVRNDDMEAAALVDRYKVLQILLNLTGNALDSLQTVPMSKRRLTIATERRATHTCIVVSDTGCGIDKGNLPLLFNQGFTTKGDGHGYGLHLSAVWANEMGGSLSCRSDGHGGGATFILELPCPNPHSSGTMELTANVTS